MEIKDSGTRRKFESGAVRDVAEGKGRCDLLPLSVLGRIYDDNIFCNIDLYIRTGSVNSLVAVVCEFSTKTFGGINSAMLEVAKQYEDGAKKYDERNWERGIPSHCYIDSAVRHYLKYKRGDDDEPHNRAFLWNILGAMWNHNNLPEMIDLPFIEREDTSCSND